MPRTNAMLLILSAAAVTWTTKHHAAMALSVQPASLFHRRLASSSDFGRHCSCGNVELTACTTLKNSFDNDRDGCRNRRIGMRHRFNQLRQKFVPKRAHSSSVSSSTGTRQWQSSSLVCTIPALLFTLLRRIALGSSPAWAVAKSSTATATTFNLSTLTSNILSSLRHPTKQTFRHLTLALATIYLTITLVESIAASRRQKIDPTSEWGRYADKPAARGMALTFLLLKLTPYAMLPPLLEKLSLTRKDEAAYTSSLPHKLRLQAGNLFSSGLLTLGPLYIKIGQILSCRENLFPSEWISAMSQLQDRVPAKSGQAAWELAYAACPGGSAGFHSTFVDFDDVPLAAASLGQVHRARLRSSGQAVAIKIQRDRLRDIYDKDLALMKRIASVVDKIGKAGQVGGVEQSWTEIFNDAEAILYREIDYRDEADNAVRFANDFGLGYGGKSVESTARGVDGNILPSASEWLRCPYTYKELSSEKFLVMEYVPSIKVSSNEKLDEAGVTVEDREYLAEALAHSYLRQFCVNKFFSTDPHPGNLGIETFEDGTRPPRIVFYDFGQACSLADDQAGGILEVIESIIDSDAKKSVVAFKRMGVLKDGADLDKVEAKCQSNYDTGKLKVKKRKKRKSARYNKMFQSSVNGDTETVQSNKADDEPSKSPKQDTPEVKDSEVMEYFTLQSEYAFVARALSQMDGVGKGLDPEFDFISAAAPYLVEIKGTRKYLVDEAKKKLKFVYDPEEGMLAKEMKLFRSLGFEPERYEKEELKL